MAVVGNPNAGKTTIFNALTGSHQKVGNYPGVTVERVSGQFQFEGKTVECIDVPGLYSLEHQSEDERVAAEVIRGIDSPKPDLLVCVIDATNLERNLFLFSQVADLRQPTLVALTMTDRVTLRGDVIDIDVLSDMLMVDVVPLVGHRDQGIKELRAAIVRNLESPRVPRLCIERNAELSTAADALCDRLARLGVDYTLCDSVRELQNPTPTFVQFAQDTPELAEVFFTAREDLGKAGLLDSTSEVTGRYAWSEKVQRKAIRRDRDYQHKSRTDMIDAVLTHRVFGLAIFVGLMYLVFQSIYTFAQPLMDLIDGAFGALKGVVSPPLAGIPMLQSLVVDGIIGGVGGMLVFLPQILILFFFIAVLEGTGYLARAAFLMDRLLGWCGLNGRAFIPLLSSFACAIPGIMSARVMPDARSRLATILVAPLMSCSARLPVYLLLIGGFIQPRYGAFWAGFALFAMHLLGLVVAVPIVWILNRRVIRGKRLPFLLELPPYQMPKWRDVWLAMYFRGRVFVQTAGTIIVAMSVLIWALSYFPRLDAQGLAQADAQYLRQYPSATKVALEQGRAEAQLANSALGRFGKAIEPVFLPAGFDWRITTSILSAFPARETVVPSLGIIFSLGGDVDQGSSDLRQTLARATWPDGRPLFDAWTAIGLMVFFALCAQCMATLATVRRETNSWKWPLFMFSYMTLLAYVAAVGVHELGKFFQR